MPRPQAPASQKIPAAAKPDPGAPQGGPPSNKFLRPTKMQAALNDAANRPPEEPGKRGAKFWFNMAVIVSIPLSLAVIGYGVWKKGLKKKIDDVKKVVSGSSEDQGSKPPEKSDHQKMLDEAKETLLKPAQTKWAVAEKVEQDLEKKKVLWAEVEKLAVEYSKKILPVIEDPRYKGPEYAWITKDYEDCMMLLRVVRDRLKSVEPVEEKPPASPNTRALGILASWNGTSQKLSVIFLSKDMSPTAPDSGAAEFGVTLGKVSAKSGDSEKALALEPMKAERMFELLRGTVREETEKLDKAGKDAKCSELAGGISVFEADKFGDSMAYAKSMKGYYFNDVFASIEVRIKDERGVGAFEEYYKLITQAIGTPVKGKENVGTGLCEWKLMWKGEGVVYFVQAIGTPGGMDITFKAFGEANQKALCDKVGEVDPYGEQGLEDWADRTPKFPSAQAPK
jgi:hypothetical protein